MDQVTREKINELRAEVDPGWAFDSRKEYLKDLMEDLIVDYWYQRTRHADYVARGRMLEDMMTQGKMTVIRKQIAKHQNEIYYRRLGMRGEQVGVTAEEIERARAHPWEDLMEFKHGKALCIFHHDHNPSFTVKNGKGRCWSCGWPGSTSGGDTIQFVMQKNGLSFAEAVKSLC